MQDVLQKGKETVIKATVSQVEIKHVVPLVNELKKRIHGSHPEKFFFLLNKLLNTSQLFLLSIKIIIIILHTNIITQGFNYNEMATMHCAFSPFLFNCGTFIHICFIIIWLTQIC